MSRAVPGVDADALAEALADHRHLAEVQDDAREARAAGVRWTPSPLIDGERDAALDDDAVRAAIAEARAG